MLLQGKFTFSEYEEMFSSILKEGYRVISMRDYFEGQFRNDEKILVNRVDVDFKIDRLPRFLDIYKKLGIGASIYVRLHAPSYNLLTIGNVNILRDLVDAGIEIGLHTELSDLEGFCGLNGETLLFQEIALLETIIGTKIYGSASHGDMTGFNNLDFWQKRNPSMFNLLYEAYDEALWKHCRYVSDSEWVHWKAYQDGALIEGDRRTPAEHAQEGEKLMLLLTHPESWYDRYIYE